MSNLIVVANGPHVATALIATHAYMGAGYLAGSSRLSSSGSYTYVLAAAPIHVWGWAMLAGAILSMAAPWGNRWWSTAAHVLAALPFLALAVAFLIAQIVGVAQGWGGSGLLLFPVAAHYLLVKARHHPEVTRA